MTLPARSTCRRLAALLAAQESLLKPSGRVLCHGDLKPSNVRVEKDTARLIDFERALHAERAWELACAADRLAIPRGLLPALWKSSGVRSGDEVARAALYRLAWTLRLTATGPGSPSARRIGLRLQPRARALMRWLK